MLSMCLSEQLLQKGNNIRPRRGPHGYANVDLLTDLTFINGLSLASAVQVIHPAIAPNFSSCP